jgi:hypothetical protein
VNEDTDEFFDFRSVGGVTATKAGPDGAETPVWDFGRVEMPEAVAAFQARLPLPVSGDTPAVRDVSEGDLPASVYLWDAYRAIFGKLPDCPSQGQVGSCVSFGTAWAVEMTMAAEIAIGHELEEWKALAREVIYGGSRVEVGGGRIRGDGSVGAWAAEFVRKWGIVARGVYGQYDLSRYSESTCRSFGDRGVPAELEAEAKFHPVKATTLVESWDHGRKLIASGYGLATCSGRGFSMRRDANGKAQPSGSWAHCMAIDGFNGTDGHVMNSWGPNAHTGPVGPGDPNTGGFWADGPVLDRMIRERDTWAFSAVEGFAARLIDWRKVA